MINIRLEDEHLPEASDAGETIATFPWALLIALPRITFFALMTSFDLEDVDLGSPNLHHKEFLCGPTHPRRFVFLAFLGADIAGGQNMPPSPGCVILRPSPGDVLKNVVVVSHKLHSSDLKKSKESSISPS